MKTLLFLVAVTMLGVSAHAQSSDLAVEKRVMGSGSQNIGGPLSPRFENAKEVGNYGVYHAPQYMPGYPTAAPIWARVVEVRCRARNCDGYNWSPDMGRGEYLFIRPVAATPTMMSERVMVPGPERVIIKNIRE
jgi:hypothetical protein